MVATKSRKKAAPVEEIEPLETEAAEAVDNQPMLFPKTISFKIQQKLLSDRVDRCSLLIDPKPSHPVLACIIFSCKDKVATIKATNLVGFISTTFELDSDDFGLAANARLFTDIVTGLKGELSITLKGNDFHIKTESGSKYRIPLFANLDEFPEFPAVEADAIALAPETLLSLLSIQKFASTEEIKQILCGVHIAFSGDQIKAGATDGKRLSCKAIAVDTLPNIAVVLPASLVKTSTLAAIKSAIASSEVINLLIDSSSTLAEIQGDDTTLIMRMLDGQYPPYEQLIPKNLGLAIECDRSALKDALKRVLILADSSTPRCNVKAKEGVMSLSIESQSGDVEEKIECSYESSDEFHQNIDPRQWLDAVEFESGEKIVIKSDRYYQKDGRWFYPPALLQSPGSESLHLVMACEVRR